MLKSFWQKNRFERQKQEHQQTAAPKLQPPHTSTSHCFFCVTPQQLQRALSQLASKYGEARQSVREAAAAAETVGERVIKGDEIKVRMPALHDFVGTLEKSQAAKAVMSLCGKFIGFVGEKRASCRACFRCVHVDTAAMTPHNPDSCEVHVCVCLCVCVLKVQLFFSSVGE